MAAGWGRGTGPEPAQDVSLNEREPMEETGQVAGSREAVGSLGEESVEPVSRQQKLGKNRVGRGLPEQ